MSKSKGYIILFRDIKDHWIWDEKPFDKKSAWIDLIMSANWNDNKVMIDMEIIDVKRGEFISSQEKLSARWGWSTTKVRAFLNMLEKDGMIVLKKDCKKTGIEIVNYEEYQNIETAKKLEKNCIKTEEKLEKKTNNTLEYKKNTKETNNKTNVQDSNFDFFWSLYPRKESKAKATLAWKKINPNDELFNEIIQGLERYKVCDKVKKGFIQLPTTWLNGKEWESVYEITKERPTIEDWIRENGGKQ